MKYSINQKAKDIVGTRENFGNAIAIDLPWELGYSCPICGNEGETLDWSEYNGFLWCGKCNKDIPSCLCLPKNIDKSIDIYLESVKFAKSKNI